MPGKDSADIEFTVAADALSVRVLQSLTQHVADMLPPDRLAFKASENGQNGADSLLIEIRTPAEKIRVVEIPKPARAGRVLDVLLSHMKAHTSGQAEISFGDWSLDTAYNTLLRPDGRIVKLTEKETAILRYLNAQKSDVPKEELLQAVWEYAEDVETHTLETHIYRLRQKIEDDPASPELVITTEKGYRLKV